MGATEKSGKKSRRLFSSLRPWKATRRLWRTRSASKAAQGECGRGRGTCYCAPRAPAFDCWGAAVAPKAVGGISRWVLGPQLTPLNSLGPTGGGDAAWMSGPAWATLHPDPWPQGLDQYRSSPGVAQRQSSSRPSIPLHP